MPNNAAPVKLNRKSVQIRENEYVEYRGEIYQISSIIDFNEVVGINIKTKRAKRLRIGDLAPLTGNEEIVSQMPVSEDIGSYTQSQFQEIQKKYLAIKPLLHDNITRDEIIKHAEKINIHYTTLYRWLKRYRSTGTLLGLLPKPSGRRKGETRLDYATEEIMQEIINTYYLSKQRPSIQSVINKVFIECKKRDIKPPSKNTIRNRIHKLSEYEVLKKHGNRKLARTKYEPAPGSFQADYPMQLVEIDHTQVDLILVDDEHREPIGRPWITVAIDIYSRMIVGYYLTLNPPSVTSVAMCVTNIVLPKENLLLELDIDSNWDVWGFPETIHVDNGADFRAEAIKAAGLAHGINIEFRPVGRANFGGHIERVIGTLMKAVHSIPGTTFSNIKERSEYDSEKHASMTFKEFEKWLVTFITKIYHKRKHEGIGMSPEQLWEEGIFGEEAPVGLLPKPADPLSVTIDFLPIFKRTIQKNGVNLDGINYYDHLLRSKIHMTDENGKKKKFIFKRDPRNIKFIWFYDDETKEYYKIPAADQSMPDMTLWELEMLKEHLKERGAKRINNIDILEAYDELHKQIEEAAKKSKKARRAKQKLKNRDMEAARQKPPVQQPAQNEVEEIEDEEFWDEDISDIAKDW